MRARGAISIGQHWSIGSARRQRRCLHGGQPEGGADRLRCARGLASAYGRRSRCLQAPSPTRAHHFAAPSHALTRCGPWDLQTGRVVRLTGDFEMARYVALVDGRSGSYGLTVPDLPCCTSAAATIDEVLRRATEAVRLWAEDALADGEKLPKPRTIEAVPADPEVAAALAHGAVLAIAPLVPA